MAKFTLTLKPDDQILMVELFTKGIELLSKRLKNDTAMQNGKPSKVRSYYITLRQESYKGKNTTIYGSFFSPSFNDVSLIKIRLNDDLETGGYMVIAMLEDSPKSDDKEFLDLLTKAFWEEWPKHFGDAILKNRH